MRFSLKTLLGATVLVACTCYSLLYPSRLLADCYYTIVLCAIAGGAIAAIYRPKEQQPFWVGFTIVVAGYWWIAVHDQFSESVQLQLYADPDKRLLPGSLVDTVLHEYYNKMMHGGSAVANPSVAYERARIGDVTRMVFVDWVYEKTNFLIIGHSAFAIAFGCVGGCFASWLSRRRERETTPLTETS